MFPVVKHSRLAEQGKHLQMSALHEVAFYCKFWCVCIYMYICICIGLLRNVDDSIHGVSLCGNCLFKMNVPAYSPARTT